MLYTESVQGLVCIGHFFRIERVLAWPIIVVMGDAAVVSSPILPHFRLVFSFLR